MASATGPEAIEYLRAHGVPDMIDEAVRDLIAKKSNDPLQFLLDYFRDAVGARTAQLTVGAEVEVFGMAINKSLNGAKGKIEGKQDEALVSFGAPFGVCAVKTSELRPISGCVAVPGDEVEAVNVESNKDLNGKKGTVKGFMSKVYVDIAGKEKIAVPQGNLKLVPTGVSEDDLEKGMEVEVQKMVIDTSLNGKRGVVKRREDTVLLKIDDVGIKQVNSMYIKPAKEGGKVEQGAEVVVAGMVLDKEMNGKKGTVKQVASKYHVAFPEIGTKLLARAALKKV